MDFRNEIKMKAVAITRLGGPEVLQLVEAPRPQPSAGQVLVRARAVGLNWLDVKQRTEDYGLKLPHVAGSDVSGTVESSGSTRFPPGSEVVVNPAYPCGQCYPCTSGDRECQFPRILGLHTDGGYGEYLAVPEQQLFAKPARLSMEQAAAFPLDSLTAWRMLVTRGQLVAGETVFIWGATGALGVAAIQLARHLGARVIAASSDPSYREPLMALGAHIVINYKVEDVLSSVHAVTDGLGVDIVFESVGRATMLLSTQIVRAGGRIVICGTRSGDNTELDLSKLYSKQVSILGSRMGTASDFEGVYSLLLNGELDVHVGRALPISEISEAHRLLEHKNFVGKIVLTHNA